MTEPEQPSNIVSLEEFRRRLQPPVSNGTETSFNGFEAADYDTYHAVRYVLTKIKGGEVPALDSYMLMIRKNVHGQPTEITNVVDDGRDLFAIGVDPDEEEAFTGELYNQDEETYDELATLLSIFPIALHIGRYVLQRDNRIQFDSNIQPPRVGDAEYNVEHRGCWVEMTQWRAASRLAIEGVSPRRPERRKKIEHYLSDVSRWRTQHDVSVARLADILGINVRFDPIGNSPMFIGGCSPLSTFDLKRILAGTPKNHKP